LPVIKTKKKKQKFLKKTLKYGYTFQKDIYLSRSLNRQNISDTLFKLVQEYSIEVPFHKLPQHTIHLLKLAFPEFLQVINSKPPHKKIIKEKKIKQIITIQDLVDSLGPDGPENYF